MTDVRPRMRLLVDINVPDKVAAHFTDRGHDVIFSRNVRVLRESASDLSIAEYANEIRGIVVTWDKDFSQLISRSATADRQRYRHAGRISYSGCTYHAGAARTTNLLPLIEQEYLHLREQRDQRLIVTIRPRILIVER